jgi:hypothetical protein
MGFDSHCVKFLLAARASGVSFARTATLGRQGLHLSAAALDQALRLFGLPVPPEDLQRWLAGGFAEPLLARLGADEVCSLDASAYEGATRVHDMNAPVPADLRERFEVVVDSGSLEHIFHVAQAVRSCMEMAAVGGHVLLLTPANNYMGHGFYQFSPELFFRVFAPEYGFQLERMLIYEGFHNAAWYKVADPAALGQRVQLLNSFHTTLLVQARKIAAVRDWPAWPQQSDYARQWQAGGADPAAGDPSALRRPGVWGRFTQQLPWPLARAYIAMRSAVTNPFRDRRVFEPVDMAGLVAGRL